MLVMFIPLSKGLKCSEYSEVAFFWGIVYQLDILVRDRYFYLLGTSTIFAH